MNFLAKTARRPAPLFQMTAMVDMVFILLAFFVMASNFRRPEKDVVAGSAAVSTAPGAVAADFPTEIRVSIRRAGSAMTVTIGEAGEQLSLAGLQAKLTAINMPDIPVRVLAEADLTVQQVMSALDAVLASPMKKVSLSKLASAGRPGEASLVRSESP